MTQKASLHVTILDSVHPSRLGPANLGVTFLIFEFRKCIDSLDVTPEPFPPTVCR